LALQAKLNANSPAAMLGIFFILKKISNMSAERFQSFEEFYPFYIIEHQNKTSRTLHFIGTFIVLILVVFFIFAQKEAKFWIAVPLVGYGFAWVGHAFFEKNKPATFKYPLWSLRGDFKLFFEILFGKRGFDASKDSL
jgi:hypothetical protein